MEKLDFWRGKRQDSQGETLVQSKASQKIGDSRACLSVLRMLSRRTGFEDPWYKWSSEGFKKMWINGALVSEEALSFL